MLIKVRKAKALGDFRLRVEFSDGTIGERDFSFINREASPMLEPPKDPAYSVAFYRGPRLTWPNGYDRDSIALHDEMKEAGSCGRSGMLRSSL